MRRLLVVYGTALAAALLVAFLVPLGLLARSLAHDRALEAARQEAQGLTVLANYANRVRLRDALSAVNAGPRRVTVFLPDGTQLGYPMSRTPSIELAAQGRAFTASVDGGVELLLPVGGAGGVAVIRSYVPEALLTEGVHRAWVTLGVVGLVLLMAAVLAGERIATRLSRSVQQLADVADRMGSGELEATVTPEGPREVVSVGRVLNSLGARIAQMLADERELGADLSHRLRTPVTALRLDVESLRDPQERERMTEHVEHLVEAVDAAVSAARHPSHQRPRGQCDPMAVVTERTRFWSVLADDTERVLRVAVSAERCEVPVSADELGAALDALIDNVFKHTADRTAFAVLVTRTAQGGAEVVVEDDGSGLATSALAERGRSEGGSTGIGLDVARRAALGVGGEFRVDRSASGGARIVMRFPPAGLPNA
jgi:signal transduction histidine kinase